MIQPKLLNPEFSMAGLEDETIFRYDQEVTDSFLDRIKKQRSSMSSSRESEYQEVADVPIAVVDKWKREGFDIMRPEVSAAQIVARLRTEGLDAFISTDKRV